MRWSEDSGCRAARTQRSGPRVWLVVTGLALVYALQGCEDKSASSACPSTPSTAECDPGAVSGRVELPAQFSSGRLREGSVVLQAVSTPAEAAYTTTLEGSEDRPADGGMNGPGARFLFEEVDAGLYLLRVYVQGFAIEALPVMVEVGGEVDVGTLRLVAEVEHVDIEEIEESGAIEGTARLLGGFDGKHHGIFVEVLDTPLNTQTGEAGQFRIETMAGTYDLRLSHPGYRERTVREVEVSPGETVTLSDRVELQSAPGRIRGAIALPTGVDSASILPQVVIALRDHAAALEDPEIEAIDQMAPGSDALFQFDDVEPGTYRLDVTHDGFEPGQRIVQVGGGQIVNVGTVALTTVPVVGPEGPSAIAGVARLQGVADLMHAGIRIEIRGSPYWAETTRDGQFRLEVPAGTWDLDTSSGL